MDYHNLYLFVKVVSRGSYTAAAQELAVPTSTLSRRIQQLEQQLGYQLLYRSARKLSLSDAGARFYNHCLPLYEELETAVKQLEGDLKTPAGRIRVTVPISLAEHVINPVLLDFMVQHTGINLDIVTTNKNLDLKEEGIDVAFRMGDIKISDWVARPLFTANFIVCAAPGLLRQYNRPTCLAELSEMPLLLSRRNPTWLFKNATGEIAELTGPGKVIYDDVAVAVAALQKGLGVANLPEYAVKPLLQQGAIEVLNVGVQPLGRPIQILYPHRDFLPTKVRLLINFVAGEFGPSSSFV